MGSGGCPDGIPMPSAPAGGAALPCGVPPVDPARVPRPSAGLSSSPRAIYAVRIVRHPDQRLCGGRFLFIDPVIEVDSGSETT